MQPPAQVPLAVPPPQPICTAPASTPSAQSTPPLQSASLAFNPFYTSHIPLYHVSDFYEQPQGYAQLQQPLGSPHHQPLPPSPDSDAEISSPTHASTYIDHYDLLQPPSPKDILMDTPPSDHLPFQGVKPIDYMWGSLNRNHHHGWFSSAKSWGKDGTTSLE